MCCAVRLRCHCVCVLFLDMRVLQALILMCKSVEILVFVIQKMSIELQNRKFGRVSFVLTIHYLAGRMVLQFSCIYDKNVEIQAKREMERREKNTFFSNFEVEVASALRFLRVCVKAIVALPCVQLSVWCVMCMWAEMKKTEHSTVQYSIAPSRTEQSEEKRRKVEINMVAKKNRLRHRITYSIQRTHRSYTTYSLQRTTHTSLVSLYSSLHIYTYIHHIHWTWTEHEQNKFKNITHILRCTACAQRTHSVWAAAAAAAPYIRPCKQTADKFYIHTLARVQHSQFSHTFLVVRCAALLLRAVYVFFRFFLSLSLYNLFRRLFFALDACVCAHHRVCMVFVALNQIERERKTHFGMLVSFSSPYRCEQRKEEKNEM